MNPFDLNIQKPKSEVREKTVFDDMKREALLEIASNRSLKSYFNFLISGYNNSILDLSKPESIDEKRDEILSLYAKSEQLRKLLKAAEDEKEKKDNEALVAGQ